MTGNGAAVVLSTLKRHGIRHVFGVPGAQVGGLMDGVSRDPYFTYVICRHEETAAHMAHGVGRAGESLAMCFGTTGPGATNMVSAVQTAAMDNTPLLVITANNPDTVIYPFKDYLQDSDNVAIYSAVTKFSARVSNPERLEELLERAIYLAQVGKPGPVHLDIPVNFLYHDNHPATRRYSAIAPSPPAPAPAAIARVVEMLAEASRPILLIGGGGVRAGVRACVDKLVQQIGIPATTTVNGRGALDTSLEECIGIGGLYGGVAYESALKNADLIIAVGCKFGSFSLLSRSDEFSVGEGQSIVQVDTDAETIGRNTPLAEGIIADALLFLEALDAALDSVRLPDWSAWRLQLQGERVKHEANVAAAMEETAELEGFLPQAQVISALEALLPEDAMVAVDGGQVAMWANTLLTPHDRLSAVYTPGAGHLGSGLPMAMGFAFAHENRPAVVITGDGALAFTIQDLATCHRYRIPVVVVVLHDSAWGIYSRFRSVFNNTKWGAELSTVDFVAVAEGFGVPARRVSRLDYLSSALNEALSSDGPFLIEIPVEYQLNPVNRYLGPATMPGVSVGPTPISLSD
jgi:acetolactate synthase-1/2/3 large subunit